ncbi:MAG: hypothetical protein WCL36_00820 [bacterium]|jgi:hypothetical protein
MNTFRIATGVALVASATVLVVAACSDSTSPTAAARNTAGADAPTLAVAPGGRASVRRQELDPRRRIPDEFRWIGEEHNRILRTGIQEYRRAKQGDPALERRIRQDCEWTIALVDRELAPSMPRARMKEGEGHATMRNLAPAIRTAARCRGERIPALSLFTAPFATAFGSTQGTDSYSAAAQAVIDRLVDRLGAATDDATVFTAIADAAAEASSMSGVDQVAVYSAASLAQGSAELWSETTATGGTLASEAPYAMALFRSTAPKTFGRFVQTDVKGCAAVLPYISKILPDWRPMAAGCLLTGVVASLAYFVI